MESLSLREESGEIQTGGVLRLELEGFRNYALLNTELSPGFNVLAGENAQGKTNFLEALYVLATSRLLRGQRDAEAILDGAERAQVACELRSMGTRLAITLGRGVRKRALLNGVGLPRASDLIGRLPCVCVSQTDMAIVRGEPADRRLFLDLELSALYPSYLRHLTMYKRALEQRNALLREGREWMQPASTYEPWEEQLAQHGSALRANREAFVKRLSQTTVDVHRVLGQGESVELGYEAKDDSGSSLELQERLAALRAADVARGSTSVGPHRDDLVVLVEGRDIRLFGSQGQQRTCVLSIKLATLEVGKQELGSAPLLLLDDIFSDLDEKRRQQLVEVVFECAEQAVLTCTEASLAGKRILEVAKLFQVSAGRVTEA